MATILGLLRKTLKRGTNAVRRVGKISRNTAKRATNTLGLTKRSKRSSSRKHRSRKH
jgi:hypothetical protein